MHITTFENTGTATIGDTTIEFTFTPRRPAVIADDPRMDDPPEDATVTIDIVQTHYRWNFTGELDDLGLLETLEERILEEMKSQGLV